MSPELSSRVSKLESDAVETALTSSQRNLLDSLRQLGAVKVADTLESILLTKARACADALEDAKFVRLAAK